MKDCLRLALLVLLSGGSLAHAETPQAPAHKTTADKAGGDTTPLLAGTWTLTGATAMPANEL